MQGPDTPAAAPGSSTDATVPPLRARIGQREAMMLVLGIVIGAGIFKAPSMVADTTGSAGWMFTAWLLGGLISMVGALCYAELATAFPHVGGDYNFLKRAWGRGVSFLFAWSRLAVINTGSLALLGFVFGDYLQQVLPLSGLPPSAGSAVYGAAAICALWWVNSRGLRAGSMAQNWLTAIELGGLLLVVCGGLWLWLGNGTPAPAVAAPPAAASSGLPAAFGLAMVFVLLTYGGWNEAACLSADLKQQPKAMVRSLVFSIAIITLLYLAVTWAYWQGLGISGMAKSQAIAADLMGRAFGPVGTAVIAAAIAIAAVTSMNATMIVGARTSYAMGCDWAPLRRLASWDGERGTPATAMRFQNVVALLLVALGAWTGGGFRAMVEFTAPVYWLFFLLTGIGLFVLRVREPHVRRPFRVPLFPLLPAVFCATCAYMLWSSLTFVASQNLGGINAAWVGIAVLAAGLLFLLVMGFMPAKPPLAGQRPIS
jgi:amino acid transporter